MLKIFSSPPNPNRCCIPRWSILKKSIFFSISFLYVKKEPQTLVLAVHVRIFSLASKHKINKTYNIILKILAPLPALLDNKYRARPAKIKNFRGPSQPTNQRFSHLTTRQCLSERDQSRIVAPVPPLRFCCCSENLAGGHDTATPSPNRVVPATVENRPSFGEETRDARTSSSRSGETGDAYFSGSRQRQTRTSPTLLHPLSGIHGQRNFHQLLNSIFCLVLCASD